jgi:hypothetical protein
MLFSPRWAALFTLLCAISIIAPVSADAEAPFYKGKRLTVLINFGAGGPTDIEGRLFAKHIARHIEGQPGIIVQNMDGAGGLIGTNWLGEVAPKDGTVMGYLTGAAWRFATEPAKQRVDLRSYEFVAYQPGTTVYYVRTDVAPGMKDATDIGRAQGLISGGLSAEASKDLLLRLALDILGVRYRYVTGYRSDNNARLALQQNEVNYYAESPPGFRSVVLPSMVNTGMVIPVYYDPGYDGEKFYVPKQVEGLAIASFPDLYEKIKGAKPSGPLWDMYLTIDAINTSMQRQLVLPPGAPRAAVDVMRAAVLELNNDKVFADEALKTIGFVPDYTAGPNTNRDVSRTVSLAPAMRAAVAEYIRNGSKK